MWILRFRSRVAAGASGALALSAGRCWLGWCFLLSEFGNFHWFSALRCKFYWSAG